MKKVIVDCEHNDPVDIRCGGPVTLGFDFYVMNDEVDGIIDFIKGEIKKNHLPLMNILIVDVDNNKKHWTRDMIAECIAEGY